jgi:fido (protein-threonine AMPylation protein)
VALDLGEQDGQTPLDPDETAGLISRHIETMGALNEWEQENILQATQWLRRAKTPSVLTESFCRELHKRMFNTSNGRHSRLVAYALLKQLGYKAFSWGSGANLASANAVRAQYLAALRAADRNSFMELLTFVRS